MDTTATLARKVTVGSTVKRGGITAVVTAVVTDRIATTITVEDGGRMVLGPGTYVDVVA